VTENIGISHIDSDALGEYALVGYTETRMNRRQFVQAGLLGLPFHARAETAGRPKNVLLLMSDQHRRDCLGIEGNRFARTPNLDALAGSGARFGAAYCSNPVCTPSRASLLTGLYTHHHQTWNNATPWPFEHKPSLTTSAAPGI
jgi:hypothetical protein